MRPAVRPAVAVRAVAPADLLDQPVPECLAVLATLYAIEQRSRYGVYRDWYKVRRMPWEGSAARAHNNIRATFCFRE